MSTVAEYNRLHPQTLEKQYKEIFSDFREWEWKTDPDALVYAWNFWPRMSIDEVALSKGELYTVITNKEKKGQKWSLAAIIKGTKNEVVTKALKQVPFTTRLGVKEMTLDLANSMDWIVRTNFMQASMTADRFHVQQIVSEAVQEIRIRERRRAIDEENELLVEWRKMGVKLRTKVYSNGDTNKQLLARSRHLLFKPQSKWTVSQRERAEILFREYPLIQKAYDLSMYFRGIFEKKISPQEATKEFAAWYKRIDVEGITELISASNTIRLNEGKIVGYFTNRETNAWAESFNAKIKWFRALVRWVRDTSFFLYRVEKLYA
jgi:transposase